MTPRTHAERSEATTAQILEAARAQFAQFGYAEASVEAIVRAADVTRGALYHHFESKADLFRAVFEQEEVALAARLSGEASRRRGVWNQLRAGCRSYLEACLDPNVRQIKLLDGPAVLGWDGVHAIEERHTIRMLRGTLRAAVEAGEMRAGNLEARANLLVGALCDGGMWVAREARPQAAVRAAVAEVDLLLDGFRT